MTADVTRPGYYRHYKGPCYQVLDEVRHSETGEWLVLYRACYGDWGLWVRPRDMFRGEVMTADGCTRPRFMWIGEDAPADLPAREG